jgi:hypothetical protein
MSFTASIDPSPVAAAFGRIEHDPVPLVKLRRVLDSEKETLRAAESNPLDYTLADRAEATAYVRLLLKVLNETAGIGPSPRVSHVKERLSDDEAIELLHTDSTGVLTHYAIAKLNEIVVCLKERTSKSGVSVATTFYNDSGVLIDDYRPLVRILHLGGTGDAYAQSKFHHRIKCLLIIIVFNLWALYRRSCSNSRSSTHQGVSFSTKTNR